MNEIQRLATKAISELTLDGQTELIKNPEVVRIIDNHIEYATLNISRFLGYELDQTYQWDHPETPSLLLTLAHLPLPLGLLKLSKPYLETCWAELLTNDNQAVIDKLPSAVRRLLTMSGYQTIINIMMADYEQTIQDNIEILKKPPVT